MKVSKDVYTNNKEVIIDTSLILPFVPEPIKMTRENSINYKLRVTPADKDSPVYEKSILVLSGDEPVRSVLQWFDSILEIVTGLNASSPEEVDNIVRRTIRNTALTAYDLKHKELLAIAKNNARMAAETHNKTQHGGTDAAPLVLGDAHYQDPQAASNAVKNLTSVADIITCYREVVTYMCPKKLVSRVKRALRRHYRKKPDMTTREWYNHFRRINDVEIPLMPPHFDKDQSLQDDEILDCLLYSIPKSWTAKMEEQGFDPYLKPLMEVIDFCERIEVSEGILSKPNKNGKASVNDEDNQKGSSKGKKNGKSPAKKSANKYCAYHGPNNTHDTKECKVLKTLREQKKDKDEKSGGSKNKSWSRKADEAKKKSEKELNALIDKAVKTKVKETLAAISKKRQSDDESDDEMNKLDLSQMDFDRMSKNENDDDSVLSCVSISGEVSV
jgi:hypothetical protein